MTPERLQTIETIFHSARELEPSSRSSFLDQACSTDAELRAEIESLLNAHESADGFIAKPAPEIAAEVLANEQAALSVGRMFGHYRLLEPLGRGGMGEVYLAADTRSGRKAALKLLPLRFTGDAERFNRFQQEARTVIGLNHPNIVTIYEIGEDNSTHYIVSELIEGETLQQRLARGRMELGEALEIALQIASALAAAHRAGIVHRDIKPENIMLRPDGYVKVLDFGIAKLAEESEPTALTKEEAPLLLIETSAGRLLGTARYMSPEQARGLSVDERTDIWSLGVVLYEMVAGCTPFNGETPTDMIVSILTSVPSTLTNFRPEVSADLQQIVAKALRKDRQERYGSINEMAKALKDLRRNLEADGQTKPAWRRRWAAVFLLLALLVAALAVSLPLFRGRSKARETENIPSIAVLPFENFSEEKANAFLAQGIQDEILTALSKISGLRVISRTSTAHLKSKPQNLADIARELGVRNILEGSVQKAGDHVHINVQLIQAQSGGHLWAQSYDRTLTDTFGVEGEVAKSVADSLKATLTPQEIARVNTKPTNNSDAYVLYLRAVEIIHRAAISLEDYNATARLLQEAVVLDPNFALAHARLSSTYGLIGHFFDPSQSWRDQALAEAKEALRLQPHLGEAHQALALCYYRGRHDYPAALAELAIAKKALPNDAENSMIEGAIARRQGRWKEAIECFQRELSLDPRSINAAQDIEKSYLFLRDWPAAIQANKQMLAVLEGQSPDLVLEEKLNGALLVFGQTGSIEAIRTVLEQCPAGFDPNGAVSIARYDFALLARDFPGAERAITECKVDPIPNPLRAIPKNELWGSLQRARGDDPAAVRGSFESSIRTLETELRLHPEDVSRHAALGMICAQVGRKEDAIREGRRAVELTPESRSALDAAQVAAVMALIYAQVGEADQAIPLIERLLAVPGPVIVAPVSITLSDLRLRWEWDPLRKDPRFQKLISGPEPKTIYK
jgi:serine/threonine protein kinase/Flp pilus assembly protein TadD